MYLHHEDPYQRDYDSRRASNTPNIRDLVSAVVEDAERVHVILTGNEESICTDTLSELDSLRDRALTFAAVASICSFKGQEGDAMRAYHAAGTATDMMRAYDPAKLAGYDVPAPFPTSRKGRAGRK